MKGHKNWSYRPYQPILFDVGEVYICRVVPKEQLIHLEWLGEEGQEYQIFYRKRQDGEFILSGTTTENEWDIEALYKETEYEFYVLSGTKRSRIRLARTGKHEGIVVNYLHPEDEAYSFSGKYLCSPSIVRHPEGYLLASMDVYEKGYPQNLNFIFRSDDDGLTWHYQCELMPCFWGELFIHHGDVYMIGCSTEYGDMLIGKSTDGGKTFSAPTALLRGSTGKAGKTGVQLYPQNRMIYNGRLYKTMEWGAWACEEYWHAPMIASCSIEDDLLEPENWSFSKPVIYDPNWPGTVDGHALGVIEGTLCVAPDGRFLDIMRYEIQSGKPPYGRVLAFEVDTEHPEEALRYSHPISMPGNRSKFSIQYDEISKKYYSIVTRIYDENYLWARNLLSLMCSEDLENWEVMCDLIDYRHEDVKTHGFQYVDFLIEGEDIIFLCRTAMNHANSHHDSNYTTFHRIKNFRNIRN